MIFIAGTLLTEGSKYVEEIRTALMGGAFLFTLAGFTEGAWLAGEDMKSQLFNIVKILIIIALVAGFPAIINQGDEALNQLHTSIAQGQQDAFRSQIEADGEEPSWSDIPSRISYSLGVCLQKIGLLGYQIVYWAKDVSILLLISVSPLLLGFLAFSYTRSIGINFLITSLTVILWNVGFALVDTLLVILGNIVMPMMGAGAAGAIVVTAGPQFLALCLVAAVLPIAMYCAVPIITGAIMRGTNVAGAAMGAYSMAHRAVSHAGTSVATGAGSFSSAQQNNNTEFSRTSAGSQALVEKGGEEGSSKSFNTPRGPILDSSSSARSMGFREGFEPKNTSQSVVASSGSSSSLHTVGASVSSPDNFMTATQSGEGIISVTDAHGNSSSRAGSISDPVTVTAAFYNHEARSPSSS